MESASDAFHECMMAINAATADVHADGHHQQNDRSSSTGSGSVESGRLEHPWQRDSGTYAEAGEIGVGAYATVMLGRNVATGVEVAMKKISVQINEDGVPQSVIREVSLLKRFEKRNHPNIVKLLDDLSMFLESAARNAVPLSESTIRRMMGDILCGVKFLHEQLIIHRDLKPQNVLISAGGQLKIADYGLARMYSLQSALTTVVVTLWYRSPELLLQCNYGFAVDVWSIGCMLAEMYRLRPLFPGASEADQLAKTFQIIGLPPAQFWPRGAVVTRGSFDGLPGYSSLRENVATASLLAFDLIRKMLAFCPDERPTVGDVLEHPYFMETPAVVIAHSSSSSSVGSSDDSGF